MHSLYSHLQRLVFVNQTKILKKFQTLGIVQIRFKEKLLLFKLDSKKTKILIHEYIKVTNFEALTTKFYLYMDTNNFFKKICPFNLDVLICSLDGLSFGPAPT